MTMIRGLAVGVIAALLVLAAVVERGDRTFDVLPAPLRAGVSVAGEGGGTWYCPGGSGPDGIAGVALEIVNAGEAPAMALVTAVRPTGDGEAGEVEVTVEATSRATVALAALAPDAGWVGALVEVAGPDVVVEQTFFSTAGRDRTPCSTRTAERWIVPFGATRVDAAGEQMVILLLNPFPDDAIVDIGFEADVGIDSVPPGLVVPARRLVAVDVTEEVTVAARVSAIVDVTAGRLVVSRIQTFNGEQARGLAVTPAAADGEADWYLPTIQRREGRTDRISVTNPSEEVAEVDVEILADGDIDLEPIELTVLPGRTVSVDLSAEERLAGVTAFGLAAHSLSGTPVAVSVDSTVMPSSDDAQRIVGAASTVGADVAATRWLIPIEGGGDESGSIVVVNPSPSAIATIQVQAIDSAGTTLISAVELGPGRRATVDVGEIAGDRPVVVVESSVPVVSGRETAGLTSRSMSSGVVASEPVAFADLR